MNCQVQLRSLQKKSDLFSIFQYRFKRLNIFHKYFLGPYIFFYLCQYFIFISNGKFCNLLIKVYIHKQRDFLKSKSC